MAVEKPAASSAPSPPSTDSLPSSAGASSSSNTAAPSPLSRFCKAVLSWDYLRLVAESKKKKPPGGLKHVKNTYTDVEDYIGVFEPLIFEEVKAQIVQGKDEEDETDWQKGVVASCTESNGFHKVSVAVLDEFCGKVSENDLLLVSKEKFEEGAAPTAYAFALVENRGGRESLTLRTFLTGEEKKQNKALCEHNPRLCMSYIFQTTARFLWILRICSLSTILREYAALHSISSLPFKDLILGASETPKEKNSEGWTWNVPRPLMDYLKSNLNDSQLDAIHAGCSLKSFVLIQGPPGTGKTQTILGLLSAILHSAPARMQSGGLAAKENRQELKIQDKYAHWMKASPWLTGASPRDLIKPVDGDDGFFPTGNELKPEVISSNRKYRSHVLVCAPSNSALDEIVLRVLQKGIHDENNNMYCPKIVRIGLKPHHSVRAVSMDYLVEQRLASVDRSSGSGKHGGNADRERIRTSILDEAPIVFSTLGFSGSSVFSRMNRAFDVVIIDEAAQAVEPATLVPLSHGCRQVFLVGDPVQLPATVISSTAEKLGYGTSLFKRLQAAGFPVQMLKVQYRMHPEISVFPSKEFYEGLLQDGEAVDRKRSWHSYRCFGPFCFFDVDGVESQPSGSGSWVNEQEIEFITVLYHQLANRYPELKSSSHVAVISPYRHQVKLLREHFRVTFGDQSDQFIDINTVDGFQGREKDVVIFSCVRANEGKGIGFVSDFRRMNVGITRARSSVLVVGSASTLKQDRHWSNLVESARQRDQYFKVPKPYASFFGEDELNTMRTKRPQELDRRIAQTVERIDNEMARVESMNVDNAEDNTEGLADDPMDADEGAGDGGYDD